MADAISESAQRPDPARRPIQVNRYDTALAIIPPRHLWPSIEGLRSLYDQHHQQWPPHINLIYPFVAQEALNQACEALSPAIRRWTEALAAQEAEQTKPQSHGIEEGERSNNEGDGARLSLSLDAVDVFERRESNTIFLHAASADQNTQLAELRASILQSLGHGAGRAYRMHMSIAQTEDAKCDAHKFLLHKIGFLPAVEWQVNKLDILVRERMPGKRLGSVMSLWGSVDLGSGVLARLESPKRFYESNDFADSVQTEAETTGRSERSIRPAFKFDTASRRWRPDSKRLEDSTSVSTPPEQLAISSYNVLGEFSWPPSQARYPILVDRILDESSKADILVLQEVQDDFLSYLLADEQITSSYPYTSHGPPSQLDLDPLPSLLNTVILSRLNFDWEWLPFHRKHKGSIVATFGQLGTVPPVLATVHLSHGLNDGAVSAKKIEVQTVLDYLTAAYAENPWLLAGDFNLPTSCYTLDRAQKAKAISTHTRGLIDRIERNLAEVGLLDAYSVARLEGRIAESDDKASDGFEGERGATYDPIVNKLAEAVVGNSLGMRPQRIDRIYVRGREMLSIATFNRFGFGSSTEEISSLGGKGATFASDHWGVRCLLKMKARESATPSSLVLGMPHVEFMPAPASMSDSTELAQFLAEVGAIPPVAEAERREKTFKAVKLLVEDATSTQPPTSVNRQQVVAVLVGSSGLGTFTSTSDMDILCIGPFSARTFFTLIVQGLRRSNASASSSDVTIRLLRRVNAKTGTMLELSVDGIKTDLQYAPAPVVAEAWPQVLRASATHPVWALSVQTLSKLKAARDMEFLIRSTPDLAVFRLAHRTIKTWAQAQGVYALKFGLLNGMAISVMLSRVHKLLVLQLGSVTAPDLLRSFYRHYAEFDWEKDMVFDPFFHKQQQQQQGRAPHIRTATEPFVVLGYHPPALNITHAASKASARTMEQAFKSAEGALSASHMQWPAFLSGNGAESFLGAFKTYIRMDVQYWGISAAKNAAFVGWFESRLVQLLVDVGRRAPDLHARIWPARFLQDATDAAAAPGDANNGSLRQESQEQETDSGFCYLIGLEKRDEALSKEALRLTIGSLQTVLRRFEAQIRGDEQYFDAKSCWMTARIIPQKDLGRLRVDQRDLGDFTLGEDEDDDQDDDELEEEDEQLTLDSGHDTITYLHNPRHRSKKDGSRSKSNNTAVATLSSAGKLRPASDVLHRLRWDSSMDSSEYVVGYEDRFLGVRERALDSWKMEQTDEEFIPQHRIVYFRRKAIGSETVADAIVWDRRTRKDAIFNSG